MASVKGEDHTGLVLDWLKKTFCIGNAGSILKAAVFQEYKRHCKAHGSNPVSPTVFGRFVRRAFPAIKSSRRGPRGRSRHHYRNLNFINRLKVDRYCKEGKAGGGEDKYGNRDEDNDRCCDRGNIIDEERQKENEMFRESEEEMDDGGPDSQDEEDDREKQRSPKNRKNTSPTTNTTTAACANGGGSGGSGACGAFRGLGRKMHLRSKKRKASEKEPSDEDGEWLPQGGREKRNRKAHAHDNSNNDSGSNNNAHYNHKNKSKKKEVDLKAEQQQQQTDQEEEEEEEREEEEIQGFRATAATGERSGKIYSRRVKTERITERVHPYVATTTTTHTTQEQTLLLSSPLPHLLPFPLHTQQSSQQPQPLGCVGYPTYPFCNNDDTSCSCYDSATDSCVNTFCPACHLTDCDLTTTTNYNDINNAPLSSSSVSSFGGSMLSSSASSAPEGVQFSSSRSTGCESEPDLSSQIGGVLAIQQQPEKAIDLFRNVYRGYYQSLFAGILQQKTEEGVRRVVEDFWVSLGQSPSFQTLRQIQEVRNFILAYDRAALSELGETMTTNPSFVQQFMGTFELCEYVKNVACYLPIWLDTSSAIALPRDLLMEAMKIRHDFAQALYKKAAAMEHRQQLFEDSCDLELPIFSLAEQSGQLILESN